MKIKKSYLFIIIIILFPIVSNAQNPIEFINAYCTGDDVDSISYCLQGLYNLGVALAVMVAFFMFLFGAFKNLLSTIPDIKSEGKTMMRNSIVGLVVIFLSGVVLYWINPAIFNPKITIYRVTKLEIGAVVSEDQLKELKGEVYDIGTEFEEQFPRLKNAIKNAELDLNQLPNNTTVKNYIQIAFDYANNDTGRANYSKKYGDKVTSLTACNYFVHRVLKEAEAIPNVCGAEKAAEFHNLLRNTNNQNHARNRGFKWEVKEFKVNDLKPGDILVKTKLSSGHGHIAIVIPVKNKNDKFRLVIAHSSLSTRRNDDGTYSGSPPRLTFISPDGFQIIVRPKLK